MIQLVMIRGQLLMLFSRYVLAQLCSEQLIFAQTWPSTFSRNFRMRCSFSSQVSAWYWLLL